MNDICKCTNNLCPIRIDCYRYRAIGSQRQAYNCFKYDEEKKSCDNFYPIEKDMRLKDEY